MWELAISFSPLCVINLCMYHTCKINKIKVHHKYCVICSATVTKTNLIVNLHKFTPVEFESKKIKSARHWITDLWPSGKK